jgi:hypothetical protein
VEAVITGPLMDRNSNQTRACLDSDSDHILEFRDVSISWNKESARPEGEPDGEQQQALL